MLYRIRLLLACSLVCGPLCMLAGCAGHDPVLAALDTGIGEETTAKDAERLVRSDPAGPLAMPDIPRELQSMASAVDSTAEALDTSGGAISYTVESISRQVPEVAGQFQAINSLTRLRDVPIYTVTSLEQRLKNALAEGDSLLRSMGYYEGVVNGRIILPPAPGAVAAQGNAAPSPGSDGGQTPPAPQVRVVVVFRPGTLYRLGPSEVIHRIRQQEPTKEKISPGSGADATTPETVPAHLPASPEDVPELPGTLADAGLAEGGPARAQDVLDAVDRVLLSFRNRGYPHAAVASTRHTLDREKKLLESQVTISSGDFARMGQIDAGGQNRINISYLDNLRTWKPGEPWSQDKVEAFRESLRNSGLFQKIELDPAGQANDKGRLDVVATLEAAPERTIGGALEYDTSFGMGITGFWENRNFTGRGDNLRVDAPLWQDMQQISAKYRLPFFLRRDQDFIAQAGAISQTTDAYDLQAARFSGGIERRVGRSWAIAVQAGVEGGSLKDPDKNRTDYSMFGLPSTVTYDTANSLLNATRGARFIVSVAPYTGKYRKVFSVVRNRLDLQAFIPLADQDRLVLAMRGSGGMVFGAASASVPPSIRFYSGGGGSVRGYEYQSLGPRNSDRDPLGGGAFLEMSLEPRFKINDNWGLVAFLDGGNVYDMPDMRYGKEIQWGAGLGFRYYTAIGPVRFDVATPLNPRKEDESLHFYISIGQSF